MEPEREFDSTLEPIYNTLKSVNTGSPSATHGENESAVSSLSGKIGASLAELTGGAWTDEISASLASNAGTIDSMVQNCLTPAGAIMGKIGSSTASLVAALTTYDDTLKATNVLVDEYNENYKKIENCSDEDKYTITYTTEKKTDKDGNEYEDKIQHKSLSDYYCGLQQKANDLKGALQTKDAELEQYKSECEALVNVVRGLLGPIGSEASAAALSISVGRTDTWKDVDLSKIDPKLAEEYPSGDYSGEGTVTYDADGNVTGKTYTIRDKEGNIVASGTIKYDEKGMPEYKEYVQKYVKPSEETTVVEHNLIATPPEEIPEKAAEGDATNLTAYTSDETVPEERTTVEQVDYTENDDGTTDYEAHRTVEEEYADGAKLNLEVEETGQAAVTENEDGTKAVDTDPEHSKATGTLETPDGEVHDVKEEENWGERGYHDKTTEISKDGETEVAATEQTAVDATLGFDTNVTKESTKVDVTEDDGTTTTTKTYSDSESVGPNSVSTKDEMTTNSKDPEVGTYTHTNERGEKVTYEYYRDEQGNLCEKLVSGEPDHPRFNDGQPVEHDYREVTITIGEGESSKTQTVTVDLGTERGQAEYSRLVTNAVAESTGYVGDNGMVANEIYDGKESGSYQFEGVTVEYKNGEAPKAEVPVQQSTVPAAAKGAVEAAVENAIETAPETVKTGAAATVLAGGLAAGKSVIGEKLELPDAAKEIITQANEDVKEAFSPYVSREKMLENYQAAQAAKAAKTDTVEPTTVEEKTAVEGVVGQDLNVKSSNTEAVTEQKDGSTTTTKTFTRTESVGNNSVSNSDTITTNSKDPEVGTYTHKNESGGEVTYEYYRDEQGNLHEKLVSGEPDYPVYNNDAPVEHDYREVTITTGTGDTAKQETVTVDLGTQRGQAEYSRVVGDAIAESTGYVGDNGTVTNEIYDGNASGGYEFEGVKVEYKTTEAPKAEVPIQQSTVPEAAKGAVEAAAAGTIETAPATVKTEAAATTAMTSGPAGKSLITEKLEIPEAQKK